MSSDREDWAVEFERIRTHGDYRYRLHGQIAWF